ncbi:MAG: Nre family DNA repair protein [Candidatus ainarchaeum sp.]|nr:Nre family DNA repair protein [Candidatus ainarchaeum sp.]
MLNSSLCIRCKGKLLCGLSKCPVLEKYNSLRKTTAQISGKEFSGSSPPSIFVSWKNYPNVSIAPLAPPVIDEKNFFFDAPEQWFGMRLEKIVSMREQLIQSNSRISVEEAANPSRELGALQEIAMSIKPVDLEVELKHRPIPRLSFHESIAPIGPIGELEKFSMISNPSIPQKIDYLVSDIDAKSTVAMQELYSSGFAVSTIYKLLSAGVLGVKKNRRLVPTRFAITAIDDNLGKDLIEKIKEFPKISEFQLFHSNYLDNDFWVLLIPSAWSFENLECWLPGGVWTEKAKKFHIVQDHEFYNGRKTYASNITGAYYSARLGVLEHLAKEKKQASAVVFREIGQGYSQPLGVWLIRQTVREAFSKKPLIFYESGMVLEYLKRKLKVPIKFWVKQSVLFDTLFHQKTLRDFTPQN